MKNTSVSRRLLWGLLSGVLLTTVAFAQGGSSDCTFTFGDSLSDGGNFFVETGDSLNAPFEPVPDAPYSIGGHHFSNGRTWIEQLTTSLHQPKSGRPASRAPGVFTNYAVGRARARAQAPVFPFFDLTTQVSTFLADYGGQAPSDAKYVVWFGSNDVRDALFELQVDPTGAASFAIIENALLSIGGNVSALYAAGAREFLVLNVPNLAITPGVLAAGAQDPVIPIVAEQLSLAFNGGLSDTLDFLGAVLPGIQFQRLDTFALLNAIVADPAAFGFEDAVNPCLTFGVQGNAICDRPNRRLFWDAAHPTLAGHAALADAAETLLLGP
jgi:phospholipase/lecithinase/hemolysin